MKYKLYKLVKALFSTKTNKVLDFRIHKELLNVKTKLPNRKTGKKKKAILQKTQKALENEKMLEWSGSNYGQMWLRQNKQKLSIFQRGGRNQ